ncbi:hypothetical protein OO015_12080 [Thermomicrobium sp. 4228-Ro]|uniref:hypothetical protein n=1 Tax=Thermomicrobium sp. 4228-Ro TaxID=2993937 RepID=UPI0022497A1B|nr:hypothetical protein [Thermomicrobium sp. 4228-Ro]MCX2728228.1 hypothetical protein [Thermomicrobium sp. 4228-Ro]
MRCLVLGVNDVASAVAHRLWCAEVAVVLASEPAPSVTRRGMAFADAVFDGEAELEGVLARRVADPAGAEALLRTREAIPLIVGWELPILLAHLLPNVLVDARMRKRAQPERLRGLAPLTIGLGPGFVAGEQVDVAIETSWEELGRVRWEGANLPLAGEPRAIEGLRRERYVYAPFSGLWRTERAIGELVEAGEPVAWIEGAAGEQCTIAAPVSGVLRGLIRDGVPVAAGTKVLEVDPRGASGQWRGIGERPRRIADGVLAAVQQWRAGGSR